jgi:hypothetical protein
MQKRRPGSSWQKPSSRRHPDGATSRPIEIAHSDQESGEFLARRPALEAGAWALCAFHGLNPDEPILNDGAMVPM